MTIHIGAKSGDIAPTVLMPGDPYRAKWAAESYLDTPRLVNDVRGMLGYTGTWRGNPVTIQGSGMGMASISIYANELIKDYNAQTLIRIGSCGAMQENIALRDVILGMTATSLSTPSRGIFKEITLHPAPTIPCWPRPMTPPAPKVSRHMSVASIPRMSSMTNAPT